MEHFQIRMDFRGRRIDAQVHKHTDCYLVWFTDSEVVHSFGGQIQISDHLKTMNGHKPGAEDEKKFHAAIVKELSKTL
ncbi:MAG: hypothetical protein ACJ749_17600 [Flavisolibacter sp.]|jgi:hypothetical protein